MIDAESCRQQASDCMRLAQGEESEDGRDILLNVALAWLRLSRQAQEREASADAALDADAAAALDADIAATVEASVAAQEMEKAADAVEQVS